MFSRRTKGYLSKHTFYVAGVGSVFFLCNTQRVPLLFNKPDKCLKSVPKHIPGHETIQNVFKLETKVAGHKSLSFSQNQILFLVE